MGRLKQCLKPIYDKIIMKIGMDKIAHFGVAGTICGICALFGTIPALLGMTVIMVITTIKESLFDEYPDLWDAIAAFIGCVIPFILTFIVK